jgi:RNA polymerase sigma-70 factor (ECF subfamily)
VPTAAIGDNDQQLLQKIAGSNMPAFHQLYQRHAAELHSYIYLFTRSKEDTEEILQDVFLKIWEKRQHLLSVENFKGYIFRMTRNMILNYLQRVVPRVKPVALNEEMAIANTEDAADQLLFKQHYALALKAIDQLPTRRKEVFNLALQEGLSFKEIAEKLGISVSAVKQHYYASVTFIREHLQQHLVITAASLLFLTLFQNN